MKKNHNVTTPEKAKTIVEFVQKYPKAPHKDVMVHVKKVHGSGVDLAVIGDLKKKVLKDLNRKTDILEKRKLAKRVSFADVTSVRESGKPSNEVMALCIRLKDLGVVRMTVDGNIVEVSQTVEKIDFLSFITSDTNVIRATRDISVDVETRPMDEAVVPANGVSDHTEGGVG